MSGIEFTIEGICYSLKNTRAPVTIKSRITGQLRTIFVPNSKAKKFERAFKKQLPLACQQKLSCPVVVEIEIFYESNQPDLDEALVLDLMQRYDVIVNDRQEWSSRSSASPGSVVVGRRDCSTTRLSGRTSELRYDDH